MTTARRTVEVRTYTLRAGREVDFAQLFRAEAAPMLRRWGVDALAFGLSPEGSTEGSRTAYLIRAYASLDERQQSQDAFYGSAEWREGPRAAILDCLDGYVDAVLDLDPDAAEALRQPL